MIAVANSPYHKQSANRSSLTPSAERSGQVQGSAARKLQVPLGILPGI